MGEEDKPYGTGDTDVAWHAAELTHLDPGTREVLEKYSKIPAEQVVPHVCAVRDKGWKIHSYPCIGQFRFTDLSLGKAPQYAEVLARVKGGERLLDAGCCFAQDLRRLVYDGAPSENLYGTDLLPEFFELGYELFGDRDTLRATLFPADIFGASARLDALDGTVDIIHASSFFHLFQLEPQREIARRFVRLLKPKPGSLVLGRHMGNETAGETAQLRGDGRLFRHDLESWRLMWSEIGRETGTRWRVEVGWDMEQERFRASMGSWQAGGARPMRYAVWRE